MNKKELKPCLLVFAGPNGSGKSTIKSMFEIKCKYTNADDVVASTGMDNLEAARLVDEMRYESIRNKEDFSFETVLSSDYKMKILRKAKSLANIKELMRLCDILHVYDNTDQAVRIIRKHKNDISIFPNPYWGEEEILKLIV